MNLSCKRDVETDNQTWWGELEGAWFLLSEQTHWGGQYQALLGEEMETQPYSFVTIYRQKLPFCF